jgi:hypothetical protein
LPPGFQVTTPLVIAAGLYEAQGVINAHENAQPPPEGGQPPSKVTATATVCGQVRTKDVNNIGTIKLAGRPKVIPYLELVGQESRPPDIGDNGEKSAPRSEIILAPGGSTTVKLRVERFGFDDRIAFDVGNLPHGVIVDDIGLSGVLVREKETERTIFLRAEPWVAEQTRTFQATALVDGNQVSLPLVMRIKRP